MPLVATGFLLKMMLAVSYCKLLKIIMVAFFSKSSPEHTVDKIHAMKERVQNEGKTLVG
jgi:ERCC4-type nuclease